MTSLAMISSMTIPTMMVLGSGFLVRALFHFLIILLVVSVDDFHLVESMEYFHLVQSNLVRSNLVESNIFESILVESNLVESNLVESIEYFPAQKHS